jgi:hypothetical protein
MSSFDDFDSEDQELILALKSAWAPAPLDADEASARLGAALLLEEDQELQGAIRAAWSPEPLSLEEGSARLEAALGSEEDTAFAEALQSGFQPQDLPPAVHAALVSSALERAHESALPQRSMVVRFLPRVAAAVSAVAIAAGVFLTVRGPAPPATISVASGDSLVAGEALATPGARTERVARARASDYRENRFRSFGLTPAGRGASR